MQGGEVVFGMSSCRASGVYSGYALGKRPSIQGWGAQSGRRTMTTIQQSRARFIAELEEEKRSAIEHMNAAGHTGCRPKACRVEEILILIEKVLMQVRVARSSKEWTA